MGTRIFFVMKPLSYLLVLLYVLAEVSGRVAGNSWCVGLSGGHGRPRSAFLLFPHF